MPWNELIEPLTQDGKCICPPDPDRLNWLTSARHIETYKSLRSKLKTDLYKHLCIENEEHWRHQFYLSILKNRIQQISYFESGPLEPRSVIIIYDFAAWPKDKPDRIEALDIEALFSNDELLKGNVGLCSYLKRFPSMAVKPTMGSPPLFSFRSFDAA